MNHWRIVVLSCLLMACASNSGSKDSKNVSTAPVGAKFPAELHWFRNSAERKAIYEQTYQAALEATVKLSMSEKPGTWAVILDVDETILDNSEYQRRLVVSGSAFSDEAWKNWVKERKASVLPGAKRFVDAVKNELHGQVVLVTNRELDVCADTEANLLSQSIVYDRILCAPYDANHKAVTDKNPRFQRVLGGDGPGNSKPLKVLVYVGDNIQDFPGFSQTSTGGFEDFGKRYFVLPNPMYGSWTKTPVL